MDGDWKLLIIIILIGLLFIIFIPTTLGFLTHSKTIIGSSVTLGAFTYLCFVNWFIDE